MTKEVYLLILQQPEIPMEFWFEYYKERGGRIPDLERFENTFSIILWNNSTIQGSDGVLKQVTFKSALNSFYEYYNKKFELWT